MGIFFGSRFFCLHARSGIINISIFWLMLRAVVVFFLLHSPETPAGIRKDILHPLGRFLTHKSVVSWLDITSSAAYAYWNGRSDAVFWGYYNGDKHNHLYGARASRWHYYKNNANLSLLLKGFCLGVYLYHIRSGNLQLRKVITREVYLLPAMNFIWHAQYNSVRYNKAFQTHAALNKSRIVLLNPVGDDIHLALQGKQVIAINFFEFTSGFLVGPLWLDPLWKY